jgi:HSP20 family molecular chaperone IbpA
METDQEAVRRVLRTSPGALARTIGHPAIMATVRDLEGSQLMALVVGERVSEPGFDIFDEGDEILVVGEMPGVSSEQLRIYGYATQIVVHVRGQSGRYSVRLPLQIEPESLSYALHNSIMTIRARPAPR